MSKLTKEEEEMNQFSFRTVIREHVPEWHLDLLNVLQRFTPNWENEPKQRLKRFYD